MYDGLLGMKLSHAITKGGETVVAQGKKITDSLLKEIVKAKIDQVEVAPNDLEGAYVAADVVDMSTGEVMVDANPELTTTMIGKLMEAGMDSWKCSSRNATKWERDVTPPSRRMRSNRGTTR